MIPWYIFILLWENELDAVTTWSSGSSVYSQNFTLMRFPFFSSAGPIEILEVQVEGMLVSHSDQTRG